MSGEEILSHTGAFERTLANLLRARFPYLYISTWEEDRLIRLATAVCRDTKLIRTPRRVLEWSLNEGFTEDGRPVEGDTKAPLKALSYIETFAEPAIFILKDFHTYFGGHGRHADAQVIRKIRDTGSRIKLSSSPLNVIFVAPELVLPKDLEKDITVLEFDLPSFAEIYELLEGMIERNNQTGRIVIELDSAGKEKLARAALGLTLHEAENAFARAMVEDGRLDASDVETILEEKRQTIKKSGILEIVKTDLQISDVGGLQNLKRWLGKRNGSWTASAARYNLPAPRGVLITGVPGCGKSLIAKTIASMWQVPLIRLDVGRIFSGIVGSSEENMRQAIRTAEAISPCILWIDEVEKGFGSATGSQGDSGTSARIFATFLTWMQEKTRPVFVVATANDISSLPPEMMRKGRFDEIFFVDLPTRTERKEILQLHASKRLNGAEGSDGLSLSDPAVDELVALTEGFVGAELEQIVVSGLFEAYHENRHVEQADFVRAVELTVPLSVTQAEQIQALRQWANVRAVAATPVEDRAAYAADPAEGAPSGSAKHRDIPDEILRTRGGRSIDF